jgi:hypothetical protein
MWLPKEVVQAVDDHARIYYLDSRATSRWNSHRRNGELRLLTGWCWVARDGDDHRQGFKTMTVAYRDAYYSLVRLSKAPGALSSKTRFKVIQGKRGVA